MIKKKHRKLIQHYLKYAQCDLSITITDEDIKQFVTYESQGTGVAHPTLLVGKRQYEIYIKSLYEDIFYFWSQGWGWAFPIEFDLLTLEDEITKDAVHKIKHKIMEIGVEEALHRFPDFSLEYKQSLISERLKNIKWK